MRWLFLIAALAGCSSGMNFEDDIAVLPCPPGTQPGAPCGTNSLCEVGSFGQVYQCVDGTWRCQADTCYDFSVPVTPDLRELD